MEEDEGEDENGEELASVVLGGFVSRARWGLARKQQVLKAKEAACFVARESATSVNPPQQHSPNTTSTL